MRPHRAVRDTPAPHVAGIDPAPLGGAGLKLEKRIAFCHGDEGRRVIRFGVNARRA